MLPRRPRPSRLVAAALVAAAAAVPIAAAPAPAATPRAATESIARRYLDAIGQRDLAAQPFAETAVMRDVTADFFDLSDLVAGVRGREAIIAMQRSWNLESIAFDLDTEFFGAEYAVFAGNATITAAEGAPRSMPFLTVLRVEDDAVTERHDFWNYAAGFGTNEDQERAGRATRTVADAYLQAYLDRRFDDARTLMADRIDFQDPTAAYFGPQGGQPIEGADELTTRRRATFASIVDFAFDVASSFVTNHHAVYVGTIRYSMPGSAFEAEVETVRFEHPGAIVIGVTDGAVTFHRDFVDYSEFRSQARRQVSSP